MKIDFQGSIVWQKCLGGTRNEYIKNISKESDGSYVLFGITQSNDGDVSGNHTVSYYYYDIWMVRLSAGGEFVSQQCIGGGGDEQMEFGVVQKGDGDYVVAGQTWYGPSYDVTCNSNHAAPDYWVFEIKDTAVGLSELPAGSGMLEVRPNPSNEWAVFSYTLPLTETRAVLGITDAQGRLVGTYTLQGREGQKLIDVRPLGPGIYFYTLTTGSLTQSGKMIVTR